MANWAVASRFLEELQRRAQGRRTLDCSAPDLVNWYSEAFPTEQNCQDSRIRVRQLLETLSDAEAISLPKGESGWLLFPPPRLPMWIKFPPAQKAARDLRHRTYPWGPELAFLASLPSVPHLDSLIAINTWLRDGGRAAELRVPLRERSIEITGREKILDAVVRCQVLQPEVSKGVTLELLKAFHAPPPLAYEEGPKNSHGKPLLVIENAHTWHSFTGWNRTAGHYAAIVYGNGKAFISSVPHLRNIIAATNAASEVRYFGDLDHAGLYIPQIAGEVALEESLPVPVPEVWLYEELLKYPSQQDDMHEIGSSAQINTLADWLPSHLRNAAKAIICQRHRIAQEQIGTAFLGSGRDFK